MIIGKAISPFALRKKNGGGGGGTDADAQLFITATGISGTNATATNQLVIDLKSANIWTKMKAVYPFVGGTSAFTHKFNLKDPRDLNAAYRLVFSGGGTFSANGYQTNSTNAFANTFLSPSVMAQNSIHGSVYSRTDANALYCDFGANTGTNGFDLLIRYVGNSLIYVNSTTNSQVNRTTSLGLYQVNRVINTHQKLFADGTSIINAAVNSVTPSTFSISIGAENFAGTNYSYSNRQYAFASFGDGLTDAESLALYNAVQLFQTTLGRQV